MPVNSIEFQPNPGSINAAYRPIIFEVVATDDEGIPVVYCDIYLDEIYYKTISRTIPDPITKRWVFDVQDACQEYLRKFIAPNGGSAMLAAPLVTAKLKCKFRASLIDPVDGFLVQDGPIPVQATLTTAAVGGGGYEGYDMYVVNATLQHEDNQNLDSHLNTFKNGLWGNLTWPMSHRPNRYLICPSDSDYFPILSFVEPTIIRLKYRMKNSNVWLDGDYNIPCTAPVPIGNPVLPDANVAIEYFYQFTVSGTLPIEVPEAFRITPPWMNIEVDGNVITLSGMPDIVGDNTRVYFEIQNCGGIYGFQDFINMSPCEPVAGKNAWNPPPAQEGKPYEYRYELLGTLPIQLVQGAISSSRFTITLEDDRFIVIRGTPDVLNVIHDPNYVIDVANCIDGGAHFAGPLECIAATGQGFSVRVGDQPMLIMLAPRYITAVYTNDGTLAVGKTVYQDAAMTTPLSGQDVRFIALAASPALMYEIDPVTGVVFGNTGKMI